ncbi:MAG: IS110 family transposase, partial [Tannerellaceae bacterium]|nr:IS110 family transposase [Tannerellaceae bacterium]
MKQMVLIGIDFSKEKFDAMILSPTGQSTPSHKVFENSLPGFNWFFKWVKEYCPKVKENVLFCGEYTGLYSLNLREYLFKKGCRIWLENPLQIKLATGLVRGKDDKVDSLRIARYACRYEDKAKIYKGTPKEVNDLELLLSFRFRLVKNRVNLQVSSSELRAVKARNSISRMIFEQSQRDIHRINKQIEGVEKKMVEIIHKNSQLKENYLLITSIKGVGIVTAVYLLIHTVNFTAFQTARQLACYCGVAPFKKDSGKKETPAKISPVADKQLKALLTQCANSAALYDKSLSAYHQRKMEQGKLRAQVINNIRNKITHRIFAVVKNKQPYKEEYICNWQNCA